MKMKRGGNFFSKKGQVTIFIVLGVIVVAGIFLFFLFRSGVKIPFAGNLGLVQDGNALLNSCLKNEIKTDVGKIMSNGGFIEVSKNHVSFEVDGRNISASYLCYTQNYGEACINQQPSLMTHIENEMKNKISQNVNDCFNEIKLNFEKQGYSTSSDSELNSFDIVLSPGKILIKTNSKIILAKAGETSTQENFRAVFPTELYNLAGVAQEIVNKETATCDFEFRGHNLLYPQYLINKVQTSDSSDIYLIKSQSTEEEFVFATRGCLIAPI